MKRWNNLKQTYEPYTIPETWFCPVYCNDMEEIVNCCNCGKEITFGDAYTSKFVQSDIGMGYPVCCTCYEIEVKEELKFKKLQDSEGT